jgi:DDE superfamily endonuclease
MEATIMPGEILSVLGVFASLMRAGTWRKAEEMLLGALLCRGSRMVSTILRVLGKEEEPRFERYHRVLNRDRWSCALMAKVLLGLLVGLLPSGFPLLVVIDETLERRKGKRISAKGYYRDAVRSSEKTVVKCLGLKWISMMLLVPLPWSKRPWALPFLTVLAPSKRSNEARGRNHRTTVDWTLVMVRLVARWLKRPWTLIGDGAYACVTLGHRCRGAGVVLISRLRLDASLYELPRPSIPGRRGRKPLKGHKIVPLKQQALDESLPWEEREVRWYGGEKKKLRLLSQTQLWYTPGEKPLPIRWVLAIDPQKPDSPQAFFCTDLERDPASIIEQFVLRWNIEVTFEEVRAHLGVETQRQWSDKAIGRTTPILMGLYSLTCLMAKNLSQVVQWKPRFAAWYNKADQATFSDVIALVRRSIWASRYFNHSNQNPDSIHLTPKQCNSLIDLISAAA